MTTSKSRRPQTLPILETPFDPSRLSGRFVVTSRSEAYPDSLTAIDTGLAKIVGEHSMEDGMLVRVLEFARGMRPNPAESVEYRTVTLGPEFFQAPLKEYKEWPVKWWREVIQNSVDAGCSRMVLGTRDNGNGTITVWAEDNGKGMDRDVLLNKFLVLGATTKVGESGKTGGFGKAKELIILPWLQWSVHTRDIVASGVGVSYEVKGASPRRGTRVEVVMSADRGSHTTLLAAREFLTRCHIPDVTFECVDESDPSNNLTIRPKSDVSKMTIIDEGQRWIAYYKASKSGEKYSDIWVRVNGLYMFSEHIDSIPGQVVIELQGPSIELLTSNRDGFRDYWTGKGVRDLGNKIAKDTTSALRAKKGHFRKTWESGKKFQAESIAPPSFLDRPALVTASGTDGSKRMTEDAVDDLVEHVDRLAQERAGEPAPPTRVRSEDADAREARDALVRDQVQSILFKGDRHLEAVLKQLAWEPDFVMSADVDNFRVPKRFYPETMTPRVKRLLQVWAETCRWVLMQLGCSTPYSVGFGFSKDFAAQYERQGDAHWLVLNPFPTKACFQIYRAVHSGQMTMSEAEGKLLENMFQVTDREQYRWLYALAVHECTHFVDDIDYHDETFASAMTLNFGKCADGMKQYKRILEVTKEGERSPRKSKTKSYVSAPEMSVEEVALDPMKFSFGQRVYVKSFDVYGTVDEIYPDARTYRVDMPTGSAFVAEGQLEAADDDPVAKSAPAHAPEPEVSESDLALIRQLRKSGFLSEAEEMERALGLV